jgi:hypothetical protein
LADARLYAFTVRSQHPLQRILRRAAIEREVGSNRKFSGANDPGGWRPVLGVSGRLFDPAVPIHFTIHDAADFIRSLAFYLLEPTTAL